MVKKSSVNASNYDEVRRYIINYGAGMAMGRYGFSSNYASWIAQSSTYEDFVKLRREKYDYYQRNSKIAEQKRKTTQDVGNRIHFAGPVTSKNTLESPFTDTTELPTEYTTKTVDNTYEEFHNTRNFTAVQLEQACRMGMKGEFIRDITNALSISSTGKFYIMLDSDPEAKEIFYKYFRQGDQVRKLRAAQKKSEGDRKRKIERENERAAKSRANYSSRSNGQKRYWDSLTEEEHNERVKRMNETRKLSTEKKRLLAQEGINDEKVSTPPVQVAEAPATEPDITVQKEIVSYKVKVNSNGDLGGVVELYKVKERRYIVNALLVSSFFMSGILALMKLANMVNIEWWECLFPFVIYVVFELLATFSVGVKMVVKTGLLPSRIKTIYNKKED